MYDLKPVNCSINITWRNFRTVIRLPGTIWLKPELKCRKRRSWNLRTPTSSTGRKRLPPCSPIDPTRNVTHSSRCVLDQRNLSTVFPLCPLGSHNPKVDIWKWTKKVDILIFSGLFCFFKHRKFCFRINICFTLVQNHIKKYSNTSVDHISTVNTFFKSKICIFRYFWFKIPCFSWKKNFKIFFKTALIIWIAF